MRLRIITLLVYATLAAVAVGTIAPMTRLAFLAASRRFSYAPDLTVPWVWLALTLAVAITIYTAATRIASGRKVGLGRYGAILIAGAVAITVRRYVPVPSRPTVEDGIAHLVARAEMASDDSYDRDKQYTDDVAALTAQWPAELRELGFYKRGAVALRTRLLVLHDTWGPALSAPPGTQPGDVVLSLSRDRRSYWISAFTLDAAERLAPLTDERGRAIVASAANGRVASRLDPLFPEYPHRIDATPATP
jgi:hypothetical protein